MRITVDEQTDINPGFDIAISGDEDFDAVLDVPTLKTTIFGN